jgi:uncharacterized protein YggE
MVRLGVNVDHVATIREARKTYEPDPVSAAVAAEMAPTRSPPTCEKTGATFRTATSA